MIMVIPCCKIEPITTPFSNIVPYDNNDNNVGNGDDVVLMLVDDDNDSGDDVITDDDDITIYMRCQRSISCIAPEICIVRTLMTLVVMMMMMMM